MVCQIQSDRYGIPDISEELETHILLAEIIKRGLNDAEFGSKSFFDMYAIFLVDKNQEILENIIESYLDSELTELMPEEIVILCKLLKKHGDSEFTSKIFHRI